MKARKAGAEKERKSSSVVFERLKFLDWEPPAEEEKAFAVKARQGAKEAELKRVTDLASKRAAEKQAARKR